MYAMKITASGAMRWSEVPDPEPRPGEILLEIHAAALNRADLLQRAGKYPPPPGWPEWPGLEAAGIVLDAPPESRWRPGDRVCALLGGGGYAERVAVPPELVLPVPEGLTLVEAASLPEAFATSYLNLVMEAGLKAGETAFIPAGASGLGVAAVQMAKLLGARVITMVGSAAKAQLVRALGADVVINRKTDDPGRAFVENPIDVVLDCVGGADLGANIEKLAPGGRWILIATLGGEHAEIALRPILKRGLRLIGSTLRSRPLAVKARILAGLEREIWPAIVAGRTRPVVCKTFPIREAELAHTVLERCENTGKVVLIIRPEE